MAYLGVRLVNGTGASMMQYVKDFKALGFDVCLLCDSDDTSINDQKKHLKDIEIIDWQNDYSIEQQLFNDLSWDKVVEMIEYRISTDNIENRSIFNNVYATKNPQPIFNENWYKTELEGLRALLGETSKRSSWYKRIDHGVVVGNIIFSGFETLGNDKRTKQMLHNLINWIDR